MKKQNSKTIKMALTIATATLVTMTAQAQTWSGLTAGTDSWNVDANWTPATFPNAAGATATFNTLTGTTTVNTGAPITVGNLNLGSNWILNINATATNTFTIDNNGSPSTFDLSGLNNNDRGLVLRSTGANSIVLNNDLNILKTNTNLGRVTFTNTVAGGAINGGGGTQSRSAGRPWLQSMPGVTTRPP